MLFVLDASVTLAWCFEDEKSVATQALLLGLKDQTKDAIVPGIWTLEVSNILVIAERQKRISYAEMMLCFEMLELLAIEIDNETCSKAFHDIAALAHSKKMTTYDAAYLELAIRRGIPLATKDKDLRKSAELLGLTVLG
jgi:predicted nucleic acid-binding protein